MSDEHRNLAIGVVLTAPSPATTGTSLTLEAGQGARFAAPCNATACPQGTTDVEMPTKAEIVRITAIAGDTLTIVRHEEGSTARSIAVGWKVFNAPTVKALTDVETVPNNEQTANYTLKLVDAGRCVDVNSATLAKVTVPTVATAKWPPGAILEVCQTGAGPVELVGAAGVTLKSPGEVTPIKTARINATLGLRKRGTTDTWTITGETEG